MLVLHFIDFCVNAGTFAGAKIKGINRFLCLDLRISIKLEVATQGV
jgi:hypothetical protein